ncbi:peptide ABC transporter substrate-binding protein [Litoreibacter roseus]|uniref:Peptide ABC transporter substrate-binding protein n=1 Tax=Litoreibacter roseus TaxID=2601869 RepID=A0A6N6JF28_9RHOB|nr:peptide ABC transporter substrate-binding protein [Litoreibacter roseus]GFE64951.1 peptide ABC transporter substrate-binding protein [Litoreibacter roseus]
MKRRTLLALTTSLILATKPLLADGHALTVHPETGEKLAADQTFSYRMLDQFPTLDPALNEETAGFHAIRQMFEALVSQDADGNIVPGVAESWETKDNQTWTFNLRQDAKWSNGDPVTANDFIYAWRRAVSPATASPYAWYIELSSIENAAEILAGEADPETLGAEAVDDYTLRVSLTQPLPFFTSIVTYATFMPVHEATIEAHGSDWTQPGNIVSNGAYVLEDVALNEYWSATKNPEYWDAESVIIEKVTGLIINDVNQALTRYESGEYDMIEPLPAGSFPRLQEERPDEAVSVPRLCSYYYQFNQTDTGHPALQDPNVRRALSLAIDRDIIVDQILQGGQTAAFTFSHAKTAGFVTPEIDYMNMSQADRDAEAQSLLQEAGFGTGGEPLELDLIYNTSENHKQIATVISQMWKQKLGVETTLSNYEWSTYLDIRKAQNFDVARSAWCADYNEASTFLKTMVTDHENNDGKYSNPQVDELMAGFATAEDPQAIYSEVERIIAADMGIAPIYHYANAFLLRADMKGWPYNNAENNWYVKDFYRVAEE